MKNNPPSRYLQTGPNRSIGPVTRAIVALRTRELAAKAGRASPRANKKAKRPVTGEPHPHRQSDILDVALVEETVAHDIVPKRPIDPASH